MHDNGIWDGVVARRTVGVLKFMISDERAFGKLAGDMESC